MYYMCTNYVHILEGVDPHLPFALWDESPVDPKPRALLFMVRCRRRHESFVVGLGCLPIQGIISITLILDDFGMVQICQNPWYSMIFLYEWEDEDLLCSDFDVFQRARDVLIHSHIWVRVNWSNLAIPEMAPLTTDTLENWMLQLIYSYYFWDGLKPPRGQPWLCIFIYIIIYIHRLLCIYTCESGVELELQSKYLWCLARFFSKGKETQSKLSKRENHFSLLLGLVGSFLQQFVGSTVPCFSSLLIVLCS